MQLLAFDFGLKQIGIASGSTISCVSSELCVLNAKEGQPNWSHVEEILGDWKPKLCLVGLPLNMDGSESELSLRATKFARRLTGRFGVSIEMVDERLSSFEAKAISQEEGHDGNYKKAPIDALAAKIILDQWLSVRASQLPKNQ